MWNRITCFALSAVTISAAVCAERAWFLQDKATRKLVRAVNKSEGIGAPSTEGSFRLPLGFRPFGTSGGFFEGWLCPNVNCAEDEAEYAVVDKLGSVLFRSRPKWSLSYRGDAIAIVVDVPFVDTDDLPAYGLPASIRESRPKTIVRSCKLPDLTCDLDAYELSSAPSAAQSVVALGHRDIVVVESVQDSPVRFLARLKEGQVVWRKDLEAMPVANIWDAELARGEVLLGSRAVASVWVLALTDGSEVFQWLGPMEEPALDTVLHQKASVLAHSECQEKPTFRAAAPREGSPTPPLGFPTNWEYISGFMRIGSGRISADGDLLFLGDARLSGLMGLRCAGDRKVFRVSRKKPQQVSIAPVPILLRPNARCCQDF